MTIEMFKNETFSGESFTSFYYEELGTSSSFSNAYFQINPTTAISVGCDPLSPQEFIQKNKKNLFKVDFAKTPQQKESILIYFASKVNETDTNQIKRMKKQNLNSKELALLYTSFIRNLFPKPNPGQLYYLSHNDGGCTLFFDEEYYILFMNEVTRAYYQGKFAESNSEIDWINLKTIFEDSTSIENPDISKLTIYSI